MDLEPGEAGVWLFRPMTEDTPDDEYVGLSAPKKPKDWEEPASLLDGLKLQEIKDPDLVFSPCAIIPYEYLFGEDHKVRTWDDVTEEQELEGTREWVIKLNDMKFNGRKKFYINNILKLGNANLAKAKAEVEAEAEAQAKAKAEAEASSFRVLACDIDSDEMLPTLLDEEEENSSF